MDTKERTCGTMYRTAVMIATSPATFFREMPKTGGFVEPLIFMVSMGIAAGLVGIVLTVTGLYIGVTVVTAAVWLVVFPVFLAVAGFIGAAVAFGIWRLAGSRESYETAYRCVAYLSALVPFVMLINIIPIVGVLMGLGFWIYFLVIVSVETHKVPARRAWLTFGLIGAAFFLTCLGAGIASRSMSRTAEQQFKEARKDANEENKALEETMKKLEKK